MLKSEVILSVMIFITRLIKVLLLSKNWGGKFLCHKGESIYFLINE